MKPSPIALYNESSKSECIRRNASYMTKHKAMTSAESHTLYSASVDIIHFVKDNFSEVKVYSANEAKEFLKAYTNVVNTRKYNIYQAKRELVRVTNPRAETSRRGWEIHYEIENSVKNLVSLEREFQPLVRKAHRVASGNALLN